MVNDETRKKSLCTSLLGSSHFICSLLLGYLCLKVSHWTYYYPFKFSAIATYVGVAYLISHKENDTREWFHPFLQCLFYLYSFIGTKYLHPTYIFSFYEGLALIGFIYTGSALRYLSSPQSELLWRLLVFRECLSQILWPRVILFLVICSFLP